MRRRTDAEHVAGAKRLWLIRFESLNRILAATRAMFRAKIDQVRTMLAVEPAKTRLHRGGAHCNSVQ